ncbi:MAG: hypothetical protein PHV23_04350 [Candidatus Gracilibacteria bacterium]|nr:hypothetical protein [Candidatus Gracilibacteria bacterium]
MNIIEQKFFEATKNILEKNLKIYDERYVDFPVILVYDFESPVSTEVSKGYIANLKDNENAEIIDFSTANKEELKAKLLSLQENSTVILVQSTNFMLDDFRIRLNLNNAGVGCLEHRHLAYIYDDQLENYADAISYNTPFYEELGEKLKKLSDVAETMTFVCNDGSTLKIEGGFEDMKLNTGNYEGKNRGGNLPIGENFTEAKIFDNVNGELTIYAFPDDKLQVEFCDPFKIKIEKSIVTCNDPKCPDNFRKILEFIALSEQGEVMVRELGFGLNPGIGKNKRVADINTYERQKGFHMSIGKKHQIYRSKMHKTVVQRYHIDIFPDIKEIYIDDKLIFSEGDYLI